MAEEKPDPVTKAADGARPYVRQELLAEVGSSGLKRFSGFVLEEFDPVLVGKKGMRIYREMRDNSAQVGAAVSLVQMFGRLVPWFVKPASTAPEDLRRAEFVQSCMGDMSFAWSDTIAEILTMIVFGWSFHELVYKKRAGDVVDPARRSRYSDGLIGWRKMPGRAQETIYNWTLDPSGGIQALNQQAPPDYRMRTIPIEKALLFRTTIEKNNPEGRSVLRSAYKSWYFLKKITEVEGIALERDLNGLPIMWVPAEMLLPNATADQKAAVEGYKEILRNVRVDEQAGLLLGQAYTDANQPLFKFELASTTGRRQHDTLAIRQDHKKDILSTILQDLIFMGSPNTMLYKGSSTPQIFAMALGGWLDNLADVFNSHAVPRLFRMNGFSTETPPKITHGPIQAPNLAALGDFLQKLVAGGLITPDPTLEADLRRKAELPAGDGSKPATGPEDDPGPDDEDLQPQGGNDGQ